MIIFALVMPANTLFSEILDGTETVADASADQIQKRIKLKLDTNHDSTFAVDRHVIVIDKPRKKAPVQSKVTITANERAKLIKAIIQRNKAETVIAAIPATDNKSTVKSAAVEPKDKTLTIYYANNIFELSQAQKEKIQRYIEGQTEGVILITSYTSRPGSPEYNLELRTKRSRVVNSFVSRFFKEKAGSVLIKLSDNAAWSSMRADKNRKTIIQIKSRGINEVKD